VTAPTDMRKDSFARRAVTGTWASLLLISVASCGGEAGYDATSTVPDTIRVLTYNIHHGEGMDELLGLERIAALIREVDPDLVALQEVDSVTNRTEQVDQAAELGRLTGMIPAFGRFMPYDGGAYGMAILSRWPILESTNIRLPDGEEPRTSLAITVDVPESERRLRFVGIHFYRTAEERLAQVKSLEAAMGETATPIVWAGDFNSTPESEVMQYLSGNWKILEKGEDRLTFSSYEPEREIDFVLVSPDSSFSLLGQMVLDEPVASDHRPVVVDLVLRD
jgi:endonuclease/exonuclease/phosphatase family metal-dependent hydrolase